MGIKITTDGKPVKVFRSEKNGFVQHWISIGKKEGDGWVNKSQPISFLKGVDVPNGADITILNAFPTLQTWVSKETQQQMAKLVWKVMEFEGPRSERKVDNYDTSEAELPDSFSQADDDIPF